MSAVIPLACFQERPGGFSEEMTVVDKQYSESGACKKVYYPVGLDLYALEKEEKAQTADNVEQSRLSAYKRIVLLRNSGLFSPHILF